MTAPAETAASAGGRHAGRRGEAPSGRRGSARAARPVAYAILTGWGVAGLVAVVGGSGWQAPPPRVADMAALWVLALWGLYTRPTLRTIVGLAMFAFAAVLLLGHAATLPEVALVARLLLSAMGLVLLLLLAAGEVVAAGAARVVVVGVLVYLAAGAGAGMAPLAAAAYGGGAALVAGLASLVREGRASLVLAVLVTVCTVLAAQWPAG